MINHTTGERFTDVTVPSSDTVINPDLNGVSVDKYTLSWPDDGWYQVQRWYRYYDTYETVCSGGRSCFVEFGGTYIVINHHTGTRTIIEIDQGSNALDKDDYGTTIGDMLRVYTGSGIGLINAPDFADTLSSLPDFEHEEMVDSIVDCDYSGTATITYINTASETGYDYAFDACQSEDYNGIYGSIKVVQPGSESIVVADGIVDASTPASSTRHHGTSHRSDGRC